MTHLGRMWCTWMNAFQYSTPQTVDLGLGLKFGMTHPESEVLQSLLKCLYCTVL